MQLMAYAIISTNKEEMTQVKQATMNVLVNQEGKLETESVSVNSRP